MTQNLKTVADANQTSALTDVTQFLAYDTSGAFAGVPRAQLSTGDIVEGIGTSATGVGGMATGNSTNVNLAAMETMLNDSTISRIFIGSGTYPFSRTTKIQLPARKVEVVGYGYPVLDGQNKGGNDIFDLWDGCDITFRGIKFYRHDKIITDDGWNAGSVTYDSVNGHKFKVKFIDCIFEDCFSVADVEQLKDRYDTGDISDNTDITKPLDCATIQFYGCSFDGVDRPIACGNVAATAYSDCVIEDCTFNRFKRFGVYLGTTDHRGQLQSKRNRISGTNRFTQWILDTSKGNEAMLYTAVNGLSVTGLLEFEGVYGTMVSGSVDTTPATIAAVINESNRETWYDKTIDLQCTAKVIMRDCPGEQGVLSSKGSTWRPDPNVDPADYDYYTTNANGAIGYGKRFQGITIITAANSTAALAKNRGIWIQDRKATYEDIIIQGTTDSPIIKNDTAGLEDLIIKNVTTEYWRGPNGSGFLAVASYGRGLFVRDCMVRPFADSASDDLIMEISARNGDLEHVIIDGCDFEPANGTNGITACTGIYIRHSTDSVDMNDVKILNTRFGTGCSQGINFRPGATGGFNDFLIDGCDFTKISDKTKAIMIDENPTNNSTFSNIRVGTNNKGIVTKNDITFTVTANNYVDVAHGLTQFTGFNSTLTAKECRVTLTNGSSTDTPYIDNFTSSNVRVHATNGTTGVLHVHKEIWNEA